MGLFYCSSVSGTSFRKSAHAKRECTSTPVKVQLDNRNKQ